MSSSPNSSSSSDGGKLPDGPLAWVLDVPCPVEFVLGTATVTVRDCIEFQRDSLVRLRQQAGADLEIRVSGIPIAAGEVVIVAENLGLRLTRILPPGAAEPA
jgi:flagellar motor switch protein FliN/FliY